MNLPTPHIEVEKKNVIAKTVLMPGDPLRAKFIADNFLDKSFQFNGVRNMLGYTGKYKGKEISVMGSGMGMPSIGIYSHELFNFYDVENIVRVGSCGAYNENLMLHDIFLGLSSWTESSYGKAMSGFEEDIVNSSSKLDSKLERAAENLGLSLIKGRIHASDIFYRENFEEYKNIRDKQGCDVVEMESYALFLNAKKAGKKAATILTVSDLLFDFSRTTSSKEREEAFTDMMKIALDASVNF